MTTFRRVACLGGLLLGACSQQSASPFTASNVCAFPRPPAGLWVAGSGAGLALARVLTVRYQRNHPDRPVYLPESIGTQGALEALGDGVIQLGVASRPLSSLEQLHGFREWPIARSALALAVPAGGHTEALSHEQLEGLFSGVQTRWPDGSLVVPFLRERGDSGEALIAKIFPGLGKALADSHARGRFSITYTEQQLRDTLAVTPGSIGYLDQGVAREEGSLHLLKLDGVAPIREAVLRGDYPLTRTLAFITRGEPNADARAFLDFTRSPDARALLVSEGYVPVEDAW